MLKSHGRYDYSAIAGTGGPTMSLATQLDAITAEVLAAAQANFRAAQARVQALQSARDNADIPALDQRVSVRGRAGAGRTK